MSQKTCIISRFDGGIAEDVRTNATNECSDSSNFDIYTNPHLLRPFSDPIAETISTGTSIMTDYAITDVIPINFSGTTKLVGWGRSGASDTSGAFFTKSTPITSSWSKIISNTGGGNTSHVPGTLIEYNGDAYAVDRQPNLIKFTSGTTYTVVGSLGVQNPDYFVCKPFVHPEDNKMYLAAGSAIKAYDGTLSSTILTLPTKWIITSLTSYGQYIAIACKPAIGIGRSVVFLWDIALRPTTVNNIIDWGDGSLEVLENLNEVLVGVSALKEVSTFDTVTNYNYIVKVFNGGSPQVVKYFIRTDTNNLRAHKAKHNDKLYFGFDTDKTIYVCGKNREGRYYVAKDRNISPSGSYTTGTLDGISFIGDIAFTAYTDGGVSGYIARTSESNFAVATSYSTIVNPNMSSSDRLEDKQLKAVQIAYRVGLIDSGSHSSTVTINYNVDNNTTLYTAIAYTQVTNGNYIVTATCNTDGSPFVSGREYTFYIQGLGDVRVKELRYKYEVLSTI